MPGELLPRIIARIKADGAMTVAEYMAIALSDPEAGYYTTRDPFGQSGDFITAPEISQMFGELIGLWSAVVWDGMGRPSPVSFAELGPGRGTLMADAIRAARGVPGFLTALTPHLVETSPTLTSLQGERLAERHPDLAPVWHTEAGTLPEHPTILVANEFLDALPIEQAVRVDGRWHERLVGVLEDGTKLAWAVGEEMTGLDGEMVSEGGQSVADGSVLERSSSVDTAVSQISRHIAINGGAALFIDYGYDVQAIGETFQAVRRHQMVDPLENPGAADLTAHVDFRAVARSAHASGCDVYGPVGQGAFLRSLGIEARAEALARAARRRGTEREPGGRTSVIEVSTALHRLIASSEMGTLFKVLAIVPHGAPPPPGPWEVSVPKTSGAQDSGEPEP